MSFGMPEAHMVISRSSKGMLSDSDMICPREMTHWLPAPNRTLSLCVSLDQTTHLVPISRVENTNAGLLENSLGIPGATGHRTVVVR